MNQNDSAKLIKATSTTSLFESSPFLRPQLWFPATLFTWYLISYVLLPIPTVRVEVDESWRAFLGWAFQH